MAGGSFVATAKGAAHVAAKLTFYFIVNVMMGASAGFLLGYDNGVMGGILAHPGFAALFLKQGVEGTTDPWCKYDDNLVQLFVSSLFLTGMLGALMGIPISNRWGRRIAMMFGGLCFLAGSGILSSSFSWPQLVAGRLVLGLGVGLATQSTPLYLMEMSPPQWRGAVNIMFQLCITVGILLAQVLNYVVAPLPYGWRISLAAGGVPAALLFIGTCFMPETPQFLVSKGRVEQAAGVARKCFGVADVSALINEMQAAADAAKPPTDIGKGSVSPPSSASSRSGMRLLFTRRYLPQLVMATVIPAAQQLTGINSIMFYAPQVFVAAGQSTSNALLSAVIIGLVNVAATGVAAVAVDRAGRRFLLLQGGAQMIVTQVAVGVLLKTLTETGGTHAMAVALVALVCLYVAGFAWSWGPLGWLVPTEMQPLATRPAGTALNACVNFAGTFLISQVFLSMLCGLKWGVFLFFAGCVMLACIFVYFLLPETKGLSEEEIGQAIAAHRVWGPLTGTADSLPTTGSSLRVVGATSSG